MFKLKPLLISGTVFGFAFFVGCAGMVNKPTGLLLGEHVNISPQSKALDLDAVKSGLTRGDYYGVMGVARDRVEVKLYTDVLIELDQRISGKREMSSEIQVEKNISELKRDLTNNKTCFLITYETHCGIIGGAKFENVIVKAKEKNGVMVDVVFDNESLRSTPRYSISSAGGITTTTWYNTGHACTNSKLNVLNGIEMFVIPRFPTYDGDKDKKMHMIWGDIKVEGTKS